MLKLMLLILSLSVFLACTSTHQMKAFKTDGCTCSPDGALKNKEAWLHCCVQHDSLYWQGGSRAERKMADSLLCDCVSQSGYPKRAKSMYRVVRMVGGAWMPIYWRWGFGYRYGNGYSD